MNWWSIKHVDLRHLFIDALKVAMIDGFDSQSKRLINGATGEVGSTPELSGFGTYRVEQP